MGRSKSTARKIQIYKITNTENGKIYVGKFKGDIFKDDYWGSGILINEEYKHHGKDKFIREVIEEFDENIDWREREKFWIKEIGSIYPKGYNLSIGGDSFDSSMLPPELRKQLHGCPGEKNGMYGRKRTEEEKKRISEGTKRGLRAIGFDNKGEKNPMYGNHEPKSNYQKEKMKASAKKYWSTLSKEEKHKRAMKSVESRKERNTKITINN